MAINKKKHAFFNLLMYNKIMEIITIEELTNYKVLPFNLYSEFGETVFLAGEILTPGKLLQLKYLNVIYRDEKEIIPPPEKDSDKKIDDIIKKLSLDSTKIESKPEKQETPPQNVEVFDMSPLQMLKSNTKVDAIDIKDYSGPINKIAKIDPQNQLKLKAFYSEIIKSFDKRPTFESLNLFFNIRDKLVQDFVFRFNDVKYSSQLKLIGEYKKCHSINVAILSGVLAQKMNLNETEIADLVLAALLHDIGKLRLPSEILDKANLTVPEQKILQSHTKIGYKILKEEFDLPENICLVALEHHEHNDGSGYPLGKSGDLIKFQSQIVSVCNFYDNLTFNRTPYLIKNSKEAVRAMLEMGTKRFLAEVLYTFCHMFSYNDSTNFENMVL